MKQLTRVMRFAAISAILVAGVATIALAIAQPQAASAAVGEGGSGWDGGPGAHPSYLFGWRVFGINEAGPYRLRNGDSWSSVQAACRAESANQIVAFILYPSSMGVTDAIVYTEDFPLPHHTYTGSMQWVGDTFPFRNQTQVRDMFDTLPASQKVGQVLGGINGTVGWFCYDSTRADWIPTPTVEYRVQTGGTGAWGAWQSDTQGVDVGDRVEFRHRIVNTGAVATTRTVNGTPSGSSLMPSSAIPGNFTLPLGTINGGATSWQQEDAFFVLNNMVGAGSICQNLSVTPTGPTGNDSTSTQACFTVRPNPQLTPTTITSTAPIYPGVTAIHVASTLDNLGTTNSDETKVGLARFVVKNGQGYDDAAGVGRTMTDTSDGYTCRLTQIYIATETPQQCDRIREETYPPNALPNASSLSFYDGDDDISALLDNLEFGDRVCYVTVVNRYGAGIGDTTWRHSSPACRIVAKLPLLQISGGDLVVRRDGSIVRGSSYTVRGERFGTWAEYGIFGPAEVTAYSGAALMAEPAAPVEGLLTFANTTDPPTKGHFGSLGVATQPTLPDWNDATISNSSRTIDQLTSGRITKPTTDLTINASTGLTGSYVIDATGHNIHIDGDIIYRDGPYGTDDDLPQVIIKAANITIAPGVHRIDAWLIASGVINTCSTTTFQINPGINYFTGLSSETCDEKLTINGPIITDRLLLRRTAGAEGTTTDSRRSPAEVFNLRADAYLWAYGQATSTQTIRTETVRDLAPRF